RSAGAVTTHAITANQRTTGFIKPPWREPAYYARHEPTGVVGKRGCFGVAGVDHAGRRPSFVRGGVRLESSAHGERHGGSARVGQPARASRRRGEWERAAGSM